MSLVDVYNENFGEFMGEMEKDAVSAAKAANVVGKHWRAKAPKLRIKNLGARRRFWGEMQRKYPRVLAKFEEGVTTPGQRRETLKAVIRGQLLGK